MKRICLLIILIFSLSITNVNAKAINNSDIISTIEYSTYDYNQPSMAILANTNPSATTADDCSVLGPQSRDILTKALRLMKILCVILCVVFTVVDFLKAIIGDEKEVYKSLIKKGLKRVVLTALLFFLPTLINIILFLIEGSSTCGIG